MLRFKTHANANRCKYYKSGRDPLLKLADEISAGLARADQVNSFIWNEELGVAGFDFSDEKNPYFFFISWTMVSS